MKRIIALCLGLPVAALLGTAQPARSDEVQDFYIKTVHLDGSTSTKGDASHAPEAFPDKTLPDGRGLVLSKPDAEGQWRVRAFTFEPSQIVVKAGQPIRLNFIGVQGPSHALHVEGDGIDERFTLQRGYMHTVALTPGKPGIIEIECYDHEPVMKGEIVVLP